MKKWIILSLFAGQVIVSSGQDSQNEPGLKTMIKVNAELQGIGFSYEPRLSKKATLELTAGAGGGYDVYEGGFDYQWSVFQPAFYFSATPKFFYNRQKRINIGRKSRLNSGNYIGLRLKYTTHAVAGYDPLWDALLINVHWGLQRVIGKRWMFATHAGLGYARDVSSQFGTPYPALDFKVSYVL